jgi:hypothetical protein
VYDTHVREPRRSDNFVERTMLHPGAQAIIDVSAN